MKTRCLAEGGDDGVVDASGADGGVAQIDHHVTGLVQAGQRGADGHGLAHSDFPGDQPEGAFGDGPGDPGGRFAVGVVAVQHAGGEVAAKRQAGETPVALQVLQHQPPPPIMLGPSPRSGTASSMVLSVVVAAWPSRAV